MLLPTITPDGLTEDRPGLPSDKTHKLGAGVVGLFSPSTPCKHLMLLLNHKVDPFLRELGEGLPGGQGSLSAKLDETTRRPASLGELWDRQGRKLRKKHSVPIPKAEEAIPNNREPVLIWKRTSQCATASAAKHHLCQWGRSYQLPHRQAHKCAIF